jgi:hypothetical protein
MNKKHAVNCLFATPELMSRLKHQHNALRVTLYRGHLSLHGMEQSFQQVKRTACAKKTLNKRSRDPLYTIKSAYYDYDKEGTQNNTDVTASCNLFLRDGAADA